MKNKISVILKDAIQTLPDHSEYRRVYTAGGTPKNTTYGRVFNLRNSHYTWFYHRRKLAEGRCLVPAEVVAILKLRGEL